MQLSLFQHRLSEIRPDERRAMCAVCGPNARVKYRKHRDEWACMSVQGKRSPAARKRKTQVANKANRWRHVPGMTEELFDQLMSEQGGVCAICGGTNGAIHLCADHCHATGRIRGLLCRHCNHAIGEMKDDPELLLRAIQYLNR